MTRVASPGRHAWAAVGAIGASRRCPALAACGVTDADPRSGGKAHRKRRNRPLFKRMSLTVGTLALALYVGAGSSAYAQDQQNNQPANPPSSSGAATQNQQNGSTSGSDMNMNDRSSRRHNRDNSMSGSSSMSNEDI